MIITFYDSISIAFKQIRIGASNLAINIYLVFHFYEIFEENISMSNLEWLLIF